MAHNTFGLTTDAVLTAIRDNRRIAAFWQGKGYAIIAQTHIENVRDLQLLLMNIRFPENTYPYNTYGEGFSPVIVVTPDNNDNDNHNDNADNAETLTETDAHALTDAIADHVADTTGELVNA